MKAKAVAMVVMVILVMVVFVVVVVVVVVIIVVPLAEHIGSNQASMLALVDQICLLAITRVAKPLMRHQHAR